MARFAAFAAGFVTGWLTRSAVSSSREAFVKLGSAGVAGAERVRRIFALEREWVDDLVAEARARAKPEGARKPEIKNNGAAEAARTGPGG